MSDSQLPPVVDTEPPDDDDPAVTDVEFELVFLDVSEDGGVTDDPVEV